MNRRIDIATGAIILFIVILLGPKILEILGGSTILLTVCVFLSYLSFYYKKFQLELRTIIIAALILIGINYLAYIEIEKTDPIKYIYIISAFTLLSLILVIIFLVATRKNIKCKRKKEIKKVVIEVSKKIFERLSFILLLSWLFVVISGLVFFAVFLNNPNAANLKEGWLKYVPLGTFWLGVAFIVTILNLRSIESYIFYTLQGKERFTIKNLKKYLIGGIILLFVFGSGMEVTRGFWFLWIETFLLFCLFIAACWTILRYYFDDRIIVKEVKANQLKTITTDFDYFLKSIGIVVLIGTLYSIVLIFLLLLE